MGAESGRLILGSLAEGKLSMRELHRFANVPVREGNSLHWNVPNLIFEIKEGLRKAAAAHVEISSISTDSWGVDYILFDESGAMMQPVFHYRDPRTKRGVEIAFSKTKWETIFSETGIQYMPINTLFQLASERPARLDRVKFLLGVGDAANYFLSGVAAIEVSMASTFQLYNPSTKSWSEDLISALGLRRRMFAPVVASGFRLGTLRPELASELGIKPLEVIATCSHDTGAAVAGVPAADKHWAYLSSGTWSLMGVELPEPIINARSRELNFTNEIGYGGTIRFLKNISGLWLIQECRREWRERAHEEQLQSQRRLVQHARISDAQFYPDIGNPDFDYSTLTRLAAEAEPFRSLINPGSEEFLAPPSMPTQIADFCRRTAQPVPESPGQFVRCCLESLALLYARTLKQIEELTERRVELLHIVGGGSNNELLNQFTANAVQVPVLAGPAEATAAGNLLIQAISLGHLSSLSEARRIVANSTKLSRFEPRDEPAWNRAAARFASLV